MFFVCTLFSLESDICDYFVDNVKKARYLPWYSTTNYKDTCLKTLTKVGKHGWGYIFIWSPAEQGHIYNFQLISGSESRRDPFSSVFQNMKNAPEHVYYEFVIMYSVSHCHH